MHQEIDKYAHNSPLCNLDPRMKVISLMTLIFSVVLLPRLELVSFALLFSIALLFVSRLPLRFALHFLKWPFMFITFFLLIMPFSIEGTPVFSVGNVIATYEGLKYGVLIALRASSAVILALIMIATTKFDTLLKALEKLKVPNALIQILMFSYRYSFTFAQEFDRMRLAARARGFNPKTSMRTLRVLGSMAGMLFVKSYERAERVFWAMRARGYDGSVRMLSELKAGRRDWAFACFIIAFAALLHLVGG